MDAIMVKKVSKVYHIGKTSIKALDDVTLEVKEGEILSVMGPSGSGKSTLLHLIGALDKPTSGEIIEFGVNITRMSERELAKFRRKNIGFVFQFFYLVPTLTALENVMLPLLPIKPKGLKEKAKSLLEEVGLGDRIYHKPGELSGGEQQRVAIARALINDTKIVIADEPTGNLDSKTGKKIVGLLKKIANKKRKILIIATHDLEVAKETDRIILLKDGRISKEVSPNEITAWEIA